MINDKMNYKHKNNCTWYLYVQTTYFALFFVKNRFRTQHCELLSSFDMHEIGENNIIYI